MKEQIMGHWRKDEEETKNKDVKFNLDKEDFRSSFSRKYI